MSSLYVLFKVADAEYAVPSGDVFQMESYSQMTPVPGAAPYVAGLTQVRQQVIPIIDTRLRFGLPAKPADSDSRFVILKYGARLVGLLVDSAREVARFNDEEFNVPPDLISQQNGGFVKSVIKQKDKFIMLIDGLKIVSQEAAHG